MDVSDEAKRTLIENNKTISRLLLENEQVLRDCGLEPPETNFALLQGTKIQIPSGYIRAKEDLIKKYRLDSIASNWTVRSNIGYALQLSDFHNYIINRFNLWGSVETVFYKSAVINFISIFEAIVLDCANQICRCASDCQLKDRCQYSFNKNQRNRFFDALKRLNEVGVTTFSEEEMKRIIEIIELRNRVHIRLANEKEFISDDFNLPLYNEVVLLVQKLTEQIIDNGVQLYHHCDTMQKLADAEKQL